jgi:glucokinase
MATSIVLGIDIGGTFTKIGLVDREGKTHGTKIFRTEAQNDFEMFSEKLKSETGLLLENGPGKKALAGIGVGAPNINSHTGKMEHPPNFSWGDAVPIGKTLESWYNLPVSTANDANAAALGELYFGMGKGMEHFVVLTLGTGLGSGIIANGKLLIGAHGMAGELGHVNVVPDGRKCKCGLRGCLETYASVTGIKRTIFELLAESTENSPLRNLSFNELSGEMIADMALAGDEIALEAFKRTAVVLGSKMADTAAHLDPQAFILSGGLSKAGDILLLPVRASMEKHLFTAYKGKVKVLISRAARDQAVLGPAALVWMKIDSGS